MTPYRYTVLRDGTGLLHIPSPHTATDAPLCGQQGTYTRVHIDDDHAATWCGACATAAAGAPRGA